MKDKNAPENKPQGVERLLKKMASGIAWLEDSEFVMRPSKRNDFSKAYSRLIESNAMVLLFLVVFSVGLFQHALIDYPRKDQKAYLAQKVLFDNPVVVPVFSKLLQNPTSIKRRRVLVQAGSYAGPMR